MKKHIENLKNTIYAAFLHEEKRRVMNNFFFLTLLQGANYILPLLTFPYLTRVLGPSLLGALAIASSLVAYFNPLTDFGFGFTATREIAIHRDDSEKTSEIFTAVMMAKFFFTLLSLGILSAIVFLVRGYRENAILFFLTFGLTVGQVLFPTWFFQGMERMQYVTFLNILAKSIFTLAIFVFVRSEKDYLLVPFFQGVGWIASGVIALIVAKRVFHIRWRKPSLPLIKNLLKDSWYIFVSSIVTSIYTISSPLFLSFYVNKENVGYFYGANKIIEILKSIFGPLSGALYPYLSHKAHYSRENFSTIIKKLVFIVGGTSFLLSIFLFFIAPFLVPLILGKEYIPSVQLLQIMSFIPFIVSLSNVLGIQTLLPIKKNKAFTTIMGMGSVFFITTCFLILPVGREVGMAWIILFTELIVLLMIIGYLEYALKFPLFRKNSTK